MLSISAPAKVNLYLHVGPVRPDGRHPLDSLVVFADARAADRLRYEATDHPLSLNVSGALAEHPFMTADENNLVLRAVRALEAKTGQPILGQITLEKKVPIAAGIGGGSSDAAATLHLLNKALDLDFTEADLCEIAVPLGGDVPACVAGRPVLMRGDGDRLEPVSPAPPDFPALIVTPNQPCPTGPVFRAFDALNSGAAFKETSPPAVPSAAGYAETLVKSFRNDLTEAAIGQVPEVADLLADLNSVAGALLARVSGSGASCFALFSEESDALTACDHIRLKYPDYWVRATRLGAAGFDLQPGSE